MQRTMSKNVATGQLPNQRTPTESALQQYIEKDISELGFQVPRIMVDEEEFWRVEGDILLDSDEFFYYIQRQKKIQELRKVGRHPLSRDVEISLAEPLSSALVGMEEDGKVVRWAPGTVLTYCVLKQTFRDQLQYQEVAENIKKAASEWEDTCGVEFKYRDDLDNSTTLQPDVVFPVRGFNAGGLFIAAAFFPNDPPWRRRILIDPSYFETPFDHVGVLRHELGHTLGFRHEHIRSMAPAICPDEDLTGTFDLSEYDPKSVMHYFCGGVGSRDLTLSDLDRLGAQKVYGPPLNTFQMYEV